MNDLHLRPGYDPLLDTMEMASRERARLEPRASPREVECAYCATLLDKDDAHWDGIHGPYCDDCWEEMN